MTDAAQSPMATPRVASGVIFRDSDGRVLLVKPTYKDGWEVPGGYVEPGESPRGAAIREVREELGVPVEPGRLLAVDWAPRDGEGDKLLFLFDGGYLDTTGTTLQAAEIDEARYHESDRLPALMPARLARRVLYALTVLDQGADPYLEHGQPTDSDALSTRAVAE